METNSSTNLKFRSVRFGKSSKKKQLKAARNARNTSLCTERDGVTGLSSLDPTRSSSSQ